MRVTLFTIGTEGDVRPFVALGRGLHKAGHEVCIATGASFRNLIDSAGLEFAPLTADFLDLMVSEARTMARGLNPLAVLATARRRLRTMSVSWVEEAVAASADAGLLIGHGMVSPLAASIGEAFDIPWVQAQLQPVTPSREIPPMMMSPPRHPLPGAINLCLYHLLRIVTWQVLSPAFNGVVRLQLGLRPYPWYGPYYQRNSDRRRTIYGYSRHVIPRPGAWPAEIEVAGYWFLDQADSWTPPRALLRFLDAGPEPIYVGFGSMRSERSSEITEQVLAALDITGRRAILATGWGGIDAETLALRDQILVIPQVPHDWLFPRVELAVHHGGAGTTAAAARAGIPSVVVPFFGDQPFWGWHLEQLGVAPPYLRQDRLSAQALADAIEAAANPAMKRRSSELGARIRAEDGVGNAIRALTGWGLLRNASVPA